ncbi:MAG: HPr family phosphocarrier protein [Planctomycetes bacterium]|nr:HPr family phosphocarrier protein [Planctomycetota bacterium]
MERRAELVVASARGIHLISASRIAALASRFGATIELRRGAVAVNAKDVADVLQLAAGPGAELECVARGEDAAAAVAALVTLFQERFGES